MTPATELWSVSLEIIAFYCVTTDLYGEKRLKVLGDRMTPALKRFAWVLRYDADVPDGEVSLWAWLLGAVITYGTTLLLWLIPYFCFVNLVAYDAAPRSRHEDISLFVQEGWSMGVIVGGCLAGWFTLRYSLPLIALNLTMSAHWLLERARVSGVLLGIGTILFSIAKGIVWWPLFREVWWGTH
jgi:hypothetical protein